jgi:hypothetical protein
MDEENTRHSSAGERAWNQNEFKLEGSGATCGEHSEPEACGRIEAEPYFLNRPLDEVPVDAATALLADGSYFALKLETKDLTGSGLADVVRSDRCDVLERSVQSGAWLLYRPDEARRVYQVN